MAVLAIAATLAVSGAAAQMPGGAGAGAGAGRGRDSGLG